MSEVSNFVLTSFMMSEVQWTAVDALRKPQVSRLVVSSIGGGGSAHFFHIIIPAQKSPKIRAQNHERKNTSAKSRVQNSKFYTIEISWKLYAGKFLGSYMLRNFLETA